MNTKEKKYKKIIPWLWIVLILAILGGSSFFGWRFYSQQKPSPVDVDISLDKRNDFKTYQKEIYGQSIAFKYPAAWKITNDQYYANEPGYNVTFELSNRKIATMDIWLVNDRGPKTLAEQKQDSMNLAKTLKTKVSFNNLIVSGVPALEAVFDLSARQKETQAGTTISLMDGIIFYGFQLWQESVSDDFDKVINSLKI